MISTLNADEWYQRVMALPRAGSENILAFYEHRLGAICCDVRCMLLPMDDHMVHRGDAVFESLLMSNRKIAMLEEHLARLVKSAKGIQLPLPCDIATLKNILLDVARASNVDLASIRVLVGRGPGGFGISPDECPESTLYVISYVYTPQSESWYEKGITACRSNIPLKSPKYAQLKTTNYGPNVLMAQEAKNRGVGETLAFDHNNCLAEGAIASVAIVDKNGIFTLPELDNIIAGTTALKAFELLGKEMPVAMRAISETELDSVKEMMVFGTGRICVGITEYEGKIVGDGKVGNVAKLGRRLLLDNASNEGTAF